jgi:uncharacterized protein YyaL (SSP411 family)
MNRLQHETSPYLLQHADNPVDWYPWGDEAFARARAEDKPILLSIGYSACHWCHVMAHESFEHALTAEHMNRLFVNIKVDREERPDVDDIYMQAVQAMSGGHGGWPMTVFLLPDGRPFYGGTYFPREPRYGIPSFRQVLDAVADAYRTRRADVEGSAASLTDALSRDSLGIGSPDALDTDLLDAAAARLLRGFDAVNGGFSPGAPKFPQPMTTAFALRQAVRTGDAAALERVAFTLRRMAEGGIYDQIGGGFHRYATDAVWLVPHFEKMLYDNAQLARLYLHAWQATGEPLFRRVATEIYDYVLREMTSAEGGFFSATDADSEGEEGRFFVWTTEQLETLLGEHAPLAIAYYGVKPGGNFEGHHILYRPTPDADIAAQFGLTVEELRARIDTVNDILYAARTQRVHPGLDDKILTAWNGMMLAALAEAARAFRSARYLDAALRCADFLRASVIARTGPEPRVWRTYKAGRAHIPGVLEDYAHLIDAFLEMYATTFDTAWFTEARALADAACAHFAAEDGGFFDTADDAETLITRPRNLQDNATPSGSAMMARNLARLAAYTGHMPYEETARRVVGQLAHAMREVPNAFGEMLQAADLLAVGIHEVAVVGPLFDPRTAALIDAAQAGYAPRVVVAHSETAIEGDHPALPLLAYRSLVNGAPTAYLCRRFACQQPVNSPDALEAQLGR